MSHRDQEVKVSGASGKNPLCSSQRQGNWGMGEAWQPLTKPLRDVPGKCRQVKQGLPSTKLPVFLGTLWHMSPTEERGTEERNSSNANYLQVSQIFSPEESAHYPLSKLQVTTHLQDKPETFGRRCIPSMFPVEVRICENALQSSWKLISNAEQGEHNAALHGNTDSPASPAQRCTEEQGWCTPCAFTTQELSWVQSWPSKKMPEPQSFFSCLELIHLHKEHEKSHLCQCQGQWKHLVPLPFRISPKWVSADQAQAQILRLRGIVPLWWFRER